MKILKTLEDTKQMISENPALILYLSHDECNVCKMLKPKIKNLLENSFPKMEFFYIDIKKFPEIGGQFSVFAVPTIITYFNSKEFMRYGRNLGVDQLSDDIKRPYNLFFND